MAPKWRPPLLVLLVCLHASMESGSVRAELWICPQSGQPDLYTDHGSVGCRQLVEATPRRAAPKFQRREFQGRKRSRSRRRNTDPKPSCNSNCLGAEAFFSFF